MPRNIIMDDIAAMAGVTKSTVSRYFNGGSVKESTKQRIQEITREYNDEPYAFARLKARESNVVGVVVPTLNSKITSRVVTSIGRYLREQGYEALIKDSDHSIDLELKNIQRLINLKVDGILLSAINITDEHREIIRNSPVPLVVLAQDYDDGICVVYDDYGAGKAMGTCVGRGPPDREGYMGGLNPMRQWDLPGKRECIREMSGDYNYESGICMAQELLDQGPLDTVITNREKDIIDLLEIEKLGKALCLL